jgi:hypothetical protein
LAAVSAAPRSCRASFFLSGLCLHPGRCGECFSLRTRFVEGRCGFQQLVDNDARRIGHTAAGVADRNSGEGLGPESLLDTPCQLSRLLECLLGLLGIGVGLVDRSRFGKERGLANRVGDCVGEAAGLAEGFTSRLAFADFREKAGQLHEPEGEDGGISLPVELFESLACRLLRADLVVCRELRPGHLHERRRLPIG